MWSENETPALSLEQLAKLLGKSVAETKAMVEERERIKDGQALVLEKQAAAVRHRQGPLRVRDDMGGTHMQVEMSKRRWLQLHRASKMEKGARGGELLGNDSDFTEWMLKRPDLEHLRVTLAKTTNRVGWRPTLANVRLQNAALHGQKERAGRMVFCVEKGAWT